MSGRSDESHNHGVDMGELLKGGGSPGPSGLTAAPRTRQNLLHLLTPKLMVVINAVVESERDIFEAQTCTSISAADEESIRRSIFEDRQWTDTLCRAPHIGPRVQRPVVWGTPSIKAVDFPSPAFGRIMPPKRPSQGTIISLQQQQQQQQQHMGQGSAPSMSPMPPHMLPAAAVAAPPGQMRYSQMHDVGAAGEDFSQSASLLIKDLIMLLQDLSISTTNNNDVQSHAFRHKLITLLTGNFGANFLRTFIAQHNLPTAPLYPCTEGVGKDEDDEDDDDDDEDDDDDGSSSLGESSHGRAAKKVKRSPADGGHHTHHGDREPCLQLFSTFPLLQKHMVAVHASTARPFVCSYDGCTRAFPTAERLTNHQLDHTSEKPFECRIEDCGRTFRSRKNRRNHEMTHAAERPHACMWEGCGKRFSRRDNMMTHYKLHTKRSKEGLSALFGRGRMLKKKPSQQQQPEKQGKSSTTNNSSAESLAEQQQQQQQAGPSSSGGNHRVSPSHANMTPAEAAQIQHQQQMKAMAATVAQRAINSNMPTHMLLQQHQQQLHHHQQQQQQQQQQDRQQQHHQQQQQHQQQQHQQHQQQHFSTAGSTPPILPSMGTPNLFLPQHGMDLQHYPGASPGIFGLSPLMQGVTGHTPLTSAAKPYYAALGNHPLASLSLPQPAQPGTPQLSHAPQAGTRAHSSPMGQMHHMSAAALAQQQQEQLKQQQRQQQQQQQRKP